MPDSELGIGIGGPGARVAVVTGVAYGGYGQSAKMVPLRAVAMFDIKQFAIMATGYVGWRFDRTGIHAGIGLHAPEL